MNNFELVIVLMEESRRITELTFIYAKNIRNCIWM